MSNPTTLAASLSSSLAYTDQSGASTLTGVEPIRYSSGLWLEDAATNYCVNPSAETVTTGWSGSNTSVTRTTDHPFNGSYCLRTERTSTAGWGTLFAQGGAGARPATTEGDVWTVRCRFFATSGLTLRLNINWRAGADGTSTSISDSSTTIVTTGAEQEVELTATAPATAASFIASLEHRAAGTVGDYWLTDEWTFRKKAYAGSYVDGAQGAGYAWDGTTHASTSTRAASSASVATANHINPTSGSLAFRFTRKIDTSGTETILECGTDGAGTDYLSIYVNSSDKLVVSWKSNGAAAQTVTSTGSIAVNTEYLVITKWNGTSVSLSLDVGTPDTGTRAAVQGSWGAGALKLEASAGGAIFNGLLVANRRTTQREDAALYNRPTWSARTLRDRIAIGAMQLRPIGA